jgi:hypothetical protein
MQRLAASSQAAPRLPRPPACPATRPSPRPAAPQVQHPVDYAKVVQRIGNEMDLTLVDLEDVLPAASVMVVTVGAGAARRLGKAGGGSRRL